MTRHLSRDDPKHVYFVRPVGMDGPIKIGCSTNPAARLSVLAAWSPFPLEIIGSVLGGFGEENRLHRRFSDLHTRREWFMSSPLLRETIERILSGVSIKDACKEIAPKKSIRNQSRTPNSPDRLLFLSYGRRIKKATSNLWRSGERISRYAPAEIREIMHNWRVDRMNNHLPVIPTKEQFALLEEFIADPGPHCVPHYWDKPKPSHQRPNA